ncbi:endo-1,4-beta-xylanase [Wenyingzhuangia sp. IMCC45467]
MKKLFCIIGCLSFLGLFAQTIPQGNDILEVQKLSFLKSNGSDGQIEVKEKQLLKISTLQQPQFIYNLASKLPTEPQNFKEGQVFLLSFRAKTETSSLETGEAKMLWLFRQSDSYKDNITSTVSISSNWQEYYIPFKASKYISKKDFRLVLQYGFKPQSFLLKDIKFQMFPMGTDINSLPKTKITYAGMEADALWRKEALKRIEQLRKGNFKVQFYKDDKPVVNQNIQIKLIKHAFPFGAAMDAQDIVAQNKRYQNFKKAFNYTVLANDLKIKSWEKPKKQEITKEALTILKNDGIVAKGHVLIWPGFQYLTPEIRKNKNNPEKVKQIITSHVTDVLEQTKNKVIKWDVVNEAYTNKDLQTITGSEDLLYSGFTLAKKIQPNALRYTNEYGIISKGGIDTQKQEWYYNFIKRIDEHTGRLVHGIGIQSHIGTDLTSPERVLQILSYYATLGKQIGISEFTMDVQDPEIREQYTRDFMIAAFSHPNVSEFLFWGCTDDERDKVDIYTEEGDIGVMGRAYFSLVHNQWKTNLIGATNNDGFVGGRGFYGEYEYTFVEDGKLITGTFKVLPRQNNTYKISL